MKNSHLNIISRKDYNAFREARQIISSEFGDKLSLLDPMMVDRISMYATLSDCSRLQALSAYAAKRKASSMFSKLSAPVMQMQAA